jgi:hypothetical protein
LISAVAEKILQQPRDPAAPPVAPLTASNQVRIDPAQFRQLAVTLERLAASPGEEHPGPAPRRFPD